MGKPSKNQNNATRPKGVDPKTIPTLVILPNGKRKWEYPWHVTN